MTKIFNSIINFFTDNKNKAKRDYDDELLYSNHAFRAFLDKFHKWGWKYQKWTVDLKADRKYIMEFIDNLGNHNIFSDSSIVGLNSQFNAHSILVVLILNPYKQTNQIKRFGKRKRVGS